MKILHFFILILFCITLSCKTVKIAQSNYGVKDGKVEWIFLQTNDVYEIAALSGGKKGGMARVATLKKDLLKENPNTYAIMSGDFVNPSVIGTLKYEGQGIKGKQMVEVMNAAGIDLVCFGNHEFDLDFVDLQKRINESNFEWISSNAFHAIGDGIEPFMQTKNGKPMPFPEYKIIEVNDGASGEKAKIGLWGVVLDFNKRDYIQYSDVFERSNSIIENILKKQSDVIMGLTHLNVDDDKTLAAKNPSVSLIMGGHDHENSKHQIGKVLITKADANAITVYVHRCSYDLKTKQVTIKSKLVDINDKIAEDPTTAAIVKKWTDIADNAFKTAGFTPTDVVATLKEDLDGRSATIRTQQNNMGAAITKAMVATAKSPLDCAFFNSGSVRIDDWVRGTITQVDIIRILPYGGKLYELDITGAELHKVLTTGLENSGRGGYLQWYNIAHNPTDKSFKIKRAPLDDAKTYRIMVNDFLISGGEGGFSYFTEKNPNVKNIDKPNAADTADLRNDIRKAFIEYLKKM